MRNHLPVAILLMLLVAACNSWDTEDRERFQRACLLKASLDGKSKKEAEKGCSCFQAELMTSFKNYDQYLRDNSEQGQALGAAAIIKCGL